MELSEAQKRDRRFIGMRATARRDGKIIPTLDELSRLVPPGMNCPHCSVEMTWMRKDSSYSTMATLQHYRDGTLGIICGACNTRHHYMPEDTYRDLPNGHKWCKDCKKIKPHDEFWRNNNPTRSNKIHTVCIDCGKSRNTKQISERRPLLIERGERGIDLKPCDVDFLLAVKDGKVGKWGKKQDIIRKKAKAHGLATVGEGRKWVLTEIGEKHLSKQYRESLK